MRVGIVGGGITGLAAACYLQKAGVNTTIVEAAPTLGGLATSFDFGPFHWDKFYHVILTSDHSLLSLLDECGLSSELRWGQTKTGFYSRDGLHSVSDTSEFLRFPVLSIWEKFRLGLGILYVARLRDGDKLEETPIVDWLVQVFGQGNYEKFWGPLLKCKLGACCEEASAAFISGYISRYYSTRQKGASKREVMGYVRGSFRTVLTRLVEILQARGTQFLLNSPVERIEPAPSGGVRIHTPDSQFDLDCVLYTGPSHVFARITPGLHPVYVNQLQAVKYLGVVCVALLLKRPLSACYVTNLVDDTLPFTGVIEMTSLVSQEETQGRHLVYLPKYTTPGDPTFSLSEVEIWRQMKAGLLRMHRDLKDEDIEKVFVFRERYVQPLPVLHYSRLVPTMETNIPGLFLANSTFVINKTLSRDQMVVIARQAADKILRTQGVRKAIASNFFEKRNPAQGDELGRSAGRDSLERLSR